MPSNNNPKYRNLEIELFHLNQPFGSFLRAIETKFSFTLYIVGPTGLSLGANNIDDVC